MRNRLSALVNNIRRDSPMGQRPKFRLTNWSRKRQHFSPELRMNTTSSSGNQPTCTHLQHLTSKKSISNRKHKRQEVRTPTLLNTRHSPWEILFPEQSIHISQHSRMHILLRVTTEEQKCFARGATYSCDNLTRFRKKKEQGLECQSV